ncbi:MAG: hypothetical protein U0610_31140 [bacterium]
MPNPTTGRRRGRAAITLVLAMACASGAARASDDAHTRVTGTVRVAARELPAQIRVLCDDPRQPEIQLAVVFASGAEAAGSDALFPFGVFEGPDGKPAPIAIQITPPNGKPWKASYTSSAGWFGVENEYLFSLKPADGKAFLKHAAAAKTVTVTIASQQATLAFTFADASESLAKAAAACR